MLRGILVQSMANREIIIKDTHRGLWYEDGVLTRVLEAGRYVIPQRISFGPFRNPRSSLPWSTCGSAI